MKHPQQENKKKREINKFQLNTNVIFLRHRLLEDFSPNRIVAYYYALLQGILKQREPKGRSTMMLLQIFAFVFFSKTHSHTNMHMFVFVYVRL